MASHARLLVTRTRALDILATVFVAACVVLVLRSVSVSSVGALVTLAAILLFAALLFASPIHWLPSIALATFAIVPNTLVPNDGVWRAIPAVGLIVALWVVRRLTSRAGGEENVGRSPRSWVIVAGVATFGFIAWALFSATLVPDLLSESSYGWITSITLGAFATMAIPFAHREAALLKATWLRVGAVVGLYSVVEVLLGSTPLYSVLYQAIGFSGNAFGAGGSSFRAQAGFGHPLWAAAFLVPPAVLGIVTWMQGGRKRELAFGMCAVAGVVATLSRGSILATVAAVGAAVILLSVMLGSRRSARIVLTVIGGSFALLAISLFPPLVARLNGVGASLSAGARQIGLDAAIQAAADSSWLGTGASTSGTTGRFYTSVVIENSFGQLLISLGIPGLVLFALIVVALVLNALQSRDIASGMALLAYVIAISTFNSIEGVRSMHLILGLLFLLCISPTPPAPTLVRTLPEFERMPLLMPAGVSPLLGGPFDKLRDR